VTFTRIINIELFIKGWPRKLFFEMGSQNKKVGEALF